MRKRTLRFAAVTAFAAAVACGVFGGVTHTSAGTATADRADSGWGALPHSTTTQVIAGDSGWGSTPFTVGTHDVAGDSGWGASPFGAAATRYLPGDSGWGGPAQGAQQDGVPPGTTTA
jgi:hypothetical protein